VSGLTVDILSTLSSINVFVLMLSKFLNFGLLLFDRSVYRQNVTCLKRFTRYEHYAGEVEDIMIARVAIVS